MAVIIGTVKGLEGKFFAKDTNQNILELKNGDAITQGMTVFGDKANQVSANIEIVILNDGQIVSINGSLEQYFDSSLHSQESVDGAIAHENIHGSDGILAALEDSEKNTEDDVENADEETAAGEDGQTTDGKEADFLVRDGNSTDINSGLRDAYYDGSSSTLNPNGDPTIPLYNALLSLDGMSVVYEGNTATYTLSVTDTPKSDLNVSIEISHIDTDSGDIVTETIVVTIPAGETTGTFTIDNIDNVYAEPDEDYNVAIVGTTGGGYDNLSIGYDNLSIGNDTVVTTILDETSPDNPTPEDVTTVSITTSDVTEDDTSVTFNIFLSNPPAEGLAATVSVEVNEKIYTVNIDENGNGSFSVPTQDSDVYIDPDSITATVTAVDGGYEKVEGIGNTAIANIFDTIDISTVTLTSTGDTSEDADTGGTITYTATLDNVANNDVTVTTEQGNITILAKGTLLADGVTFADGLTGTLTIDVSKDNDDSSGEDKYIENDTVSNKITAVSEDATAGETGSFENLGFNGTEITDKLLDDDDTTTLSIFGTTALVEGEVASYVVSITNPPKTDMEVEVKISNITTNGDVVIETKTITIAVGKLASEPFEIINVEDLIDEEPEDYKVEILSYDDNGEFEEIVYGNKEVITKITDDDIAPEAKDNANVATETGTEFVANEDLVDTDIDGYDDGIRATGNVITDDIGTNPLSITSIEFNSQSYSLTATDTVIDGAYGTLTINSSGTYTYTVNENTTDKTTRWIPWSMLDTTVVTKEEHPEYWL